MQVRETEAIVLRQYALIGADCIVVFLTRELGTLRAVARGVKKPRSGFGSSLEPLTHVRVQLFAREGSDLGRILQCEMMHSYLGKNPTLDRLYGFSYVAELAQELAPENSPSALLFRLVLAVLEAGERDGVNQALVRYFELWALKLNGWLPNYDYCPACGRCVKEDGFYVWLEAGQGRCRACAEDRGIRIGPEAASLLQGMLELSPRQFVSRVQPGAGPRDLERLTQKLLEWHLEKRLKSYIPMREILGNG
jgi:DNA repair protein RecO (recombination protein O)